jgi:hypothetical protein
MFRVRQRPLRPRTKLVLLTLAWVVWGFITVGGLQTAFASCADPANADPGFDYNRDCNNNPDGTPRTQTAPVADPWRTEALIPEDPEPNLPPLGGTQTPVNPAPTGRATAEQNNDRNNRAVTNPNRPTVPGPVTNPNRPTLPGAVTNPNQGNGAGTGVQLRNPLAGISSIPDLLAAVLNVIIIIAIPIIIFFLMLAGFKYVTARGNPSTISEASQALLYAIIGGVLILGATAIAQIIKNLVNAFRS